MRSIQVGIVLSGLFGLACGRLHSVANESRPKVVANITTTEQSKLGGASAAEASLLKAADETAKEHGTSPASSSLSGQVVLNKAALQNRTFLYGFDLQYTSATDPVYQLTPQAMALGHIPATFRLINGTLQLLADQSANFESNINHPELLLATWRVLAETEATITIAFEHTGLVINEAINGMGAPAPKQTWVRSLKFVEQGEYILQESALMLQDGTVETFLESIFPRENIVPQNYPSFDLLENPVADRYRFLTGGSVYVNKAIDGQDVRVPTAFASHYDITQNKTIDWYVTPNIPDKFLPALKSGIEGWNRYYAPQQGRQIMRFMGRLPEGISIGDPRYNVVNWDSVARAGAAYESQATDLLSGIQSHSLIYLPYAWYNIGVDLWKMRKPAEKTQDHPDSKSLMKLLAPKAPQVASKSMKRVLACMLSADDQTIPLDVLLHDGQMGSQKGIEDLDEFGMRLISVVLLHEVGHALGMAHNFKGSLAFDGSKPASESNPTTWSVMDYNYYQFEQDIFTKVGEIEGPNLEYDRQFISALYNQSKDVAATDATVPTCDDSEADKVLGGVDPECVRYDSENNPIKGLVHARNNLFEKTGAGGTEAQTLTEVLEEIAKNEVAHFQDTASNPSKLSADALDLATKIGHLSHYFIRAGAQSLRVNLRNNAKALRVWAGGVGLDEAHFRQTYLSIFKEVLEERGLPAHAGTALKALVDAIAAAVIANPAAGAELPNREALAAELTRGMMLRVAAALPSAWSNLRTTAYSELDMRQESPFAIAIKGSLTGIESFAATTLSNGVLNELDAAGAPMFDTERKVAAMQLRSFKGISPLVEQTILQLEAFVVKGQAQGNQYLVDTGRALLSILR